MTLSFNLPRLFLLLLGLCVAAAAQERPPAPEGEDELRVTVEEVRVTVAAYGAGGRFDATLSAEDLLVREDGVAQQVRGVYRAPAEVLLVLDTGGETNPAILRKEVMSSHQFSVFSYQ